MTPWLRNSSAIPTSSGSTTFSRSAWSSRPVLLKELGPCPVATDPDRHGVDCRAHVEQEFVEARACGIPGRSLKRCSAGRRATSPAARAARPFPDELHVRLPEHDTTLSPTWAVAELGAGEQRWQLLVRIEAPGIDPDERGALEGWEATPHQRFERLLRETGVFAGCYH